MEEKLVAVCVNYSKVPFGFKWFLSQRDPCSTWFKTMLLHVCRCSESLQAVLCTPCLRLHSCRVHFSAAYSRGAGGSFGDGVLLVLWMLAYITGFSLRHNNISPSLFLCLNTFVSALWKQFSGHPILLSLHCSFQQLRAILVSRLFKNVCYLSGF